MAKAHPDTPCVSSLPRCAASKLAFENWPISSVTFRKSRKITGASPTRPQSSFRVAICLFNSLIWLHCPEVMTVRLMFHDRTTPYVKLQALQLEGNYIAIVCHIMGKLSKLSRLPLLPLVPRRSIQ